MKISVIIPVYNGEKYVAGCIENMLRQTYKNLEIIVVNDGSTDRSAEIIAEYPAVRVISQSNQGLSAARNAGMDAASGDYIHFMDVDDMINLEYYEAMSDAVALTNADMAFGGVWHEAYPENSLAFSHRYLLTTPKDKMTITCADFMGYAWRYIIKRQFIEEHKLRFVVGKILEDLPFTLEAIAKAKTVVTVPEAMYNYVNRPGSIMSSTGKANEARRKNTWKEVKVFRNSILTSLGLGTYKDRPIRKYDYKILGVVHLREVVYANGITKWFMGGVRVARKKQVRL